MNFRGEHQIALSLSGAGVRRVGWVGWAGQFSFLCFPSLPPQDLCEVGSCPFPPLPSPPLSSHFWLQLLCSPPLALPGK